MNPQQQGYSVQQQRYFQNAPSAWDQNRKGLLDPSNYPPLTSVMDTHAATGNSIPPIHLPPSATPPSSSNSKKPPTPRAQGPQGSSPAAPPMSPALLNAARPPPAPQSQPASDVWGRPTRPLSFADVAKGVAASQQPQSSQSPSPSQPQGAQARTSPRHSPSLPPTSPARAPSPSPAPSPSAARPKASSSSSSPSIPPCTPPTPEADPAKNGSGRPATLESGKDVIVADRPGQTPSPEADNFGLMGLLRVIVQKDGDLSALALGCDLTSLGLNLSASEPLYAMFHSPVIPQLAGQEPVYTVPGCYYQHQLPDIGANPKLYPMFKEETLMYIFYKHPQDMRQIYAATELFRRQWIYHKSHQFWFRPSDPASEPQIRTSTYETRSCDVFDPKQWTFSRREGFTVKYEFLVNQHGPVTSLGGPAQAQAHAQIQGQSGAQTSPHLGPVQQASTPLRGQAGPIAQQLQPQAQNAFSNAPQALHMAVHQPPATQAGAPYGVPHMAHMQPPQPQAPSMHQGAFLAQQRSPHAVRFGHFPS